MRPEEARVLSERNIMPARGATFSRGDDGALLFKFVIDPMNVVGPRPATRKDQAEYPGEWAAFLRAEDLLLKRDGVGDPGAGPVAEVVAAPGAAPEPKVRRTYTRKPKR